MIRLLNKIYFVASEDGNDLYCFDYWNAKDGKNYTEKLDTFEAAQARQLELAGYTR